MTTTQPPNVSDDVPTHRNTVWPDGQSDPEVHFRDRPTRTAEQILAEAKAARAADAQRAESAALAQLSAPIITNDPTFLRHVHAMAGNVVVDAAEGAPGTFQVYSTPNSPPDTFLKAPPLQTSHRNAEQTSDQPRSLRDGRVFEQSSDGMTARVRRPVEEPPPDPFVQMASAPFPKTPGETSQKPNTQPQGGSPVPRGVGVRSLKSLDTTPKEDWSFYKYMDAVPGLKAVRLPSNDVFYSAQVSMRPFAWEELWGIAQGIEDQNLTPIIDAIGSTVQFSEVGLTVRDLTLPDFFYLMYMQRLLSYPSTPLTYSYVSRYGNAASFTVTETTLVTKILEESPEDYKKAWADRGLSPPRVKDLEALQGLVLSEEDTMLWDRAQWLAGNSIEEKIAHAKVRGIPALELVRDFKASPFYSYGVDEVYTVRDPLFQPTVYLSKLVSEYETQLALRQALVGIQGPSSDDIDVLDISLVALKKEIDDLKQNLENGIVVEPEEEDVRVTVNALTFFPNI